MKLRSSHVLCTLIGSVVLSSTAPVMGQCDLQKLTASDSTTGDDFGAGVSVDGTIAVFGAPENDDAGSSSGSAYVFRFDGTVWTQEQKLNASDADSGDDYGWSAAVSGDTIVIGAPRDDTVAGNTAGSAYVYRFNGGTLLWEQEAHIFASDAGSSDRFGQSVAIDGDTILVGAIQNDDILSNAGAGYVFTRIGSTWLQQAKLIDSSPTGTSPQLGRSCALDGDVAVLGAWQSAPKGMFSVGRAVVFRRTGMTWDLEQRLSASDAADFRWFGIDVDVSGNTIVVGAFGDRSPLDLSEEGGIYFFDFALGTWTQQQNLNASNAAANNRFGWSVAIANDVAIVGTGSSGSNAYYFSRVAGTWSEASLLNSTDVDVTGEYGHAVATNDGTAMIGDIGSGTGGRSFVFDLLGPDCNENGICDSRDIAQGTSFDLNTNGIPDECEADVCSPDCAVPNDGEVNITDLLELISQWGGVGSCDIDASGGVDVADLLEIISEWGTCP